MELAGRVALVTGAGIRVGRAIAMGLAGAGARIAVHYNASAEGADAVVEEIKAAGGDAAAFRADLSRADTSTPLIDAVVERFGALDVLINSAGVMYRTPIGTITPEMWDTIFAINLRAPFFVAQAAAAHLSKRGGAIVNISDLAGLETWSEYIPHGISKAGVIQMTRALAHALAPRIRVNAVAPGAVLSARALGQGGRRSPHRNHAVAPVGKHVGCGGGGAVLAPRGLRDRTHTRR